MNISKFKQAESDYDFSISERIISGRLTPLRYRILTRIVRKFNREHSAPYGVSPNGYAYNCGCERDCCGCMTSEKCNISFADNPDNTMRVKITYSVGFNY